MGSKKSSKESSAAVIIMNGKPFEVPPGGTLGILALGNVGIRAWKKASMNWKEKETKEAGNEEKK